MKAAEDSPAAPTRSDWSLPAAWSLGFLCLISVFNYLDRSLLGLALPLIKAEMHASDTMLGLVSGLAFVLFYAILGVPIAWAADRWNRRNIIAFGFAFWSLMTALTGYVGNIWQLAVGPLPDGRRRGLLPAARQCDDFGPVPQGAAAAGARHFRHRQFDRLHRLVPDRRLDRPGAMAGATMFIAAGAFRACFWRSLST